MMAVYSSYNLTETCQKTLRYDMLHYLMNNDFQLIWTKQYKTHAKKWLEAIGRQENVSVVFFPRTDRFIRIGQLLTDRELLHTSLGSSSRYIFQKFDLDAHDVEDIFDLHYQITEQLNLTKLQQAPLTFSQWMKFLKQNNIALILVVPEADKFLNPDGKTVLSILSSCLDEYSPTIRVISFFETDISHITILPMISTSSRLYENIFWYPLYEYSDSLAFIDLLKAQWNVTLTQKQAKDIVDQCGGHFWLIKEAVREVVRFGKWSISEEGMMLRLRAIYETLLPSEQRVMQKLCAHKFIEGDEEEQSRMYLQRMNVIGENNECFVHLFNEYIVLQSKKTNRLFMKNNHIFLNDIPLDQFLSRKEYRIMSVLLENQGTIVTRDTMAKYIWPSDTDEKYSDWAIDQLITRLRKRLEQLSIPSSAISVIRGKGYQFKY